MYTSIETRFLRAAMTVTADQYELRTYLRHLHVSPKGYLEASNGHVAHRIQLTWVEDNLEKFAADYPKGYLIPTRFLTPGNLAKSSTISFDFTAGVAYPKNLGIQPIPIPQQEIGRIYPDLDRVIPGPNRIGEKTDQIGFNPEYLAPTQKALKSPGCQFQMDGASASIRVHWYGIDPAEFVTVLMPMRF